jgi:hypothetical protein
VAPVVVRSYERIHSSDEQVRDEWRRHWDKVQSGPSVLFLPTPQMLDRFPSGDDGEDDDDPDLLMLGFTPRSLDAVVDAGLAAVFWWREGSDRRPPGEPDAPTLSITPASLLPQSLHHWRTQARRHPGAGLLWDDPGRFPGGFPSLRAPL